MTNHEAIYKLNPLVVTIRGDEAFDAEGNQVQYDAQAVQDYINANAYKRQRAAAYPSFADQLDMMYHGGYEAWRTAIESVKNQFPKPQ